MVSELICFVCGDFARDTASLTQRSRDEDVGGDGVSAKTGCSLGPPAHRGRRVGGGTAGRNLGGSMTLRSPLLALGVFALAACADPVAPRTSVPNVPDGP